VTDASNAEHWIVNAPRRTHVVFAPATLLLDEGKQTERTVPMVVFGFLMPEGEPMLHVALVCPSEHLRRAQRELDRAIAAAIRKANAYETERRARSGGRKNG
jgi:hypothetical protein